MHLQLLSLSLSLSRSLSQSCPFAGKMLISGLRSKKVRISRALFAQCFIRRLSSQTGRLEGKVALITGAASGIGKATAAKFISNGAKVIIADVNHALGRAAADELGPDAAFVPCDVSDESAVSAAVNFAVARHGRLDIMHNNAGIPCRTAASVTDLDMSAFDTAMRVNVRGAMAGVKHAARVMIPRHAGCILLTASVTALMGGLAQHAYTVSKCAVAGIIRSAAAELGTHGIRVNGVSPFAVPTPFVVEDMRQMFPGVQDERFSEMIFGAGVLRGARGETEDMANAALYLASDEAKYVSGHNLVVDGGFTCFKRFDFSPPNQDQ